MAVRGWPRILLWALAGGFLAGASQLGVAYGLSIVRWDRPYSPGQEGMWSAQVTWAPWIAATAVIFGCWVGVWTAGRLHRRPHIAGRVVTALAGAAGAAVTVPLTFLPARVPQPTVAHPGREAALASLLGLAVGVLAATAVLSVPPLAGNVVTTVIWVWLAAFVSLAHGETAPRLGAPAIGPLTLVMVLITVLAAAAIAGVARWGGAKRLAVAASGLGGPALIAAAYAIAGPRAQAAPYTAALIAVAASLGASVGVAFARKPTRRPRQEPVPVPAQPDPSTAPALPAVPARSDTGQRTVQLAPVGTHEEDYVDWVKGLGGDSSEGSRSGPRRTRSKPRSEPADPSD